VRRFRNQAEPPAPAAPPAGLTAETSILDSYVAAAPSPQNPVDIFAGEWSSSFPAPLEDLRAGSVPLFEDHRVPWAVERWGGLAGRSVLELGPLEGGHTYGLLQAGASSVLAIEAQTRAYLKCLVAKELLGMDRARFLLGDFVGYLRATDAHFDAVFACGVLYHMRNPVETLALTAKVADRLFLWTHYYDESLIGTDSPIAGRFSSHEPTSYQGFEHVLHRFNYEEALQFKGFCGGSAAHTNWLSRDDLLGALDHVGWKVEEIGLENPDHPNGPSLALTAQR
jgi:hypothetical protein